MPLFFTSLTFCVDTVPGDRIRDAVNTKCNNKCSKTSSILFTLLLTTSVIIVFNYIPRGRPNVNANRRIMTAIIFIATWYGSSAAAKSFLFFLLSSRRNPLVDCAWHQISIPTRASTHSGGLIKLALARQLTPSSTGHSSEMRIFDVVCDKISRVLRTFVCNYAVRTASLRQGPRVSSCHRRLCALMSPTRRLQSVCQANKSGPLRFTRAFRSQRVPWDQRERFENFLLDKES